ncbi:hypothetical protein [Campylobacter sp.]|nr:hypothetical protein [Campylobacter sp.]
MCQKCHIFSDVTLLCGTLANYSKKGLKSRKQYKLEYIMLC